MPGGHSIARQPLLGVLVPSPVARGMGRLLLHDLIQPSFSFLVGVALPFSLAGRLARGQSKIRMTAHALWRSLILVFLGVFLRSLEQYADQFHVRGYAQPDRPRLHVSFRAGLLLATSSVGRLWR